MSGETGVSAGGVLVAFVAGAAVGAAVALLFAPATGAETRDFLGHRAREGADRASDAAHRGREAWNRRRDHLTSAFERVREAQRHEPEQS